MCPLSRSLKNRLLYQQNLRRYYRLSSEELSWIIELKIFKKKNRPKVFCWDTDCRETIQTKLLLYAISVLHGLVQQSPYGVHNKSIFNIQFVIRQHTKVFHNNGITFGILSLNIRSHGIFERYLLYLHILSYLSTCELQVLL